MNQDRRQRLEQEQELLNQLANRSEILQLQSENEPADRYVLTFTAKLIERANDSTDEVHWTDHHKIELEIPWSFPNSPPDVRWLTRFYHPNVSSSGFVSLKDIGLMWDQQMSLDVLAERLWDVARHAWYDLENADNYSASRWIKNGPKVKLPVDERTIVPPKLAKPENIISYRRKGKGDQQIETGTLNNFESPVEILEPIEIIEDPTPASKAPNKKSEPDVVYLDDDNIIDAEIVPRKKRDDSDDDFLIIE